MVALTLQIILTIVSFLASCLAIVAVREVMHNSDQLKEDMGTFKETRTRYIQEINEIRKEHYELSNKVNTLLKKV